jgi:phage I-like protein
MRHASRVAPRDAYALGPKRLALRAHVGISGADPETRTSWIDIAGPGEWKGHPAGAFTLTPEVFASCIAAFDAQANPIEVDYDHASLTPNPDGGSPAAGWVQALEMRGDRLWACVEWTARAAARIRAGEFRYCSGVFDFDSVDRKTGGHTVCAMDSVALTNRPFIDGQQPIALSRQALTEITMPEDMPPAAPANMDDAGKMFMARLMEVCDMDAAACLAALDANIEAVAAAMKGGKGEAPASVAPPAAPAAIAPASDVAALTAQVTALSANLAAREAELAPLRASAAKAADDALVAEVDAGVKAGKVAPSARAEFVKLARETPTAFRAILAAMPATTVLAPSNAPATPPPGQAHSIDKEAKRRELTARMSGSARIVLTPKQIEETVNRQLAELYPEGN